MTPAPLPAVDIVVNNHNYGAYVCDAIDSALRQDHPAVHVVVVDDGSTDDSRQRLERYAGAVELVLKQNGGQASALNAGFERCRGGVVIFLDADDLLEPDTARRAATAFAAQPTASRVHFRMELIDAAGRPLGRTEPPSGEPLPSGDLRRAELAFPFDMTWVGTSGNAFRTEALRRIMPISEAEYGRWGADWYLIHLATLLGPVVAFDEPGALYRVHGANAFQPAAPQLDLDRIRREIAYQQATARSLSRLAAELRLDPPEPILSLSNIALRVISRKLEPDRHPVTGDRLPGLMTAAVRAARRRYNASAFMRLLLLTALGAIAVAPRGAARRLAELLVFPELRPGLARVTGANRGRGSAASRPEAIDPAR